MSVTKVPMKGVNTAVDTAAGDDANIGWTAGEGLILTGQGSTSDITIKNDADSNVMTVATGTQTAAFAGDVTLPNTGELFIGDTVNANVTVGMTINQHAADNSVIELKSSDVAHGFTDIAETDSYGFIKKNNATPDGGGLEVMGVAETAIALLLRGLGGSVGTGDTAGTTGQVTIEGSTDDGSTDIATLADANNVLAVRNHLTTRLIVKGNGVLHITNTSPVAIDTEDDAMLIRTLDLLGTKEQTATGIIETQWDDFIEKNDSKLKEIGVLSSENDFIAVQPWVKLANGAIWQQRAMFETLKQVAEEMLPGFSEKLNERLEAQSLPALPV